MIIKRIVGKITKEAARIHWKKVELLSRKHIVSSSYDGISRKARFIAENGGEIRIGKHVTVMDGGYLSSVENGKIEIQDRVFINRNFSAVSRGSLFIGNDTSIGPGVFIYDHDHYFGSKHRDTKYNVGRVKIGENCWIGCGVIILKNAVIGNNCVIGAGSVVSGNIPDNTLVKCGRNTEMEPIQ